MMLGRVVLLALCLSDILPAAIAVYQGCQPHYTACANCCDINRDCICDNICGGNDPRWPREHGYVEGLGCSYRPPQGPDARIQGCPSGYKKCPTCCDINPDCYCDQICGGNGGGWPTERGYNSDLGCSYNPIDVVPADCERSACEEHSRGRKDDDCCAIPGHAFCAEGYTYTRGQAGCGQGWTHGVHTTCCKRDAAPAPPPPLPPPAENPKQRPPSNPSPPPAPPTVEIKYVEKSTGGNDGALIGIVIAVIVCILLAAACCFKHHQAKQAAGNVPLPPVRAEMTGHPFPHGNPVQGFNLPGHFQPSAGPKVVNMPKRFCARCGWQSPPNDPGKKFCGNCGASL